MVRFCLRNWALILIVCAITGCGGDGGSTTTASTGHDDAHGDHDDHDQAAEADDLPQDFASAVAIVAKQTSAIKDAFASDQSQDADAAVHEAARVLRAIPDLITGSNLSAEDQTAAGTAANTVFAALQDIHKGFHGGDQVTKYGDVAENLEAAVKTLQEKAASLSDH